MCNLGKTIKKQSILIAFCLLSLAVFPPLSQADYIRVKGTVVNVRQGPGTTYPVLFQAEKGEEFTLVRTEGLWCLIVLQQQREAWVFRKLVNVLPGTRPGELDTGEPETSQKGESSSLFGKVVSYLFGLLLLITAAIAFWKRRPLVQYAGRKFMEMSGYRREQPFRYDNRKPNDDSWEL
jgi:hypothetical protein